MQTWELLLLLQYYNLFLNKGNNISNNSLADNVAIIALPNANNNDFFILNFLQIEALGHTLYTYYSILLILLSFIILMLLLNWFNIKL